MSACEATDIEPGREPEMLVCDREWGHEPPHLDEQDGIEWSVTLDGAQR